MYFLFSHQSVFHSGWIKVYVQSTTYLYTIFNQARVFHGDSYVFEIEQEIYP